MPVSPGSDPARPWPRSVSRGRLLSVRLSAGIAGAIAAIVLFVVFAVQNGHTAPVVFLVWGWPGTPVFAVILCSVAVGFVIGVLFMGLRAGPTRRARRSGPPPSGPPAPALGATPPGTNPGG